MILKCREKHSFTEQFKISFKNNQVTWFILLNLFMNRTVSCSQISSITFVSQPSKSRVFRVWVCSFMSELHTWFAIYFFLTEQIFWLVYMYRRTNEWCLIYLYLIDKSSCSQMLLNSFLSVCVFVCMWGTERVWWGSGESFSRGN